MENLRGNEMFTKLQELLSEIQDIRNQKVHFIMHEDGCWEIRGTVQGYILYDGDGEKELDNLWRKVVL